MDYINYASDLVNNLVSPNSDHAFGYHPKDKDYFGYTVTPGGRFVSNYRLKLFSDKVASLQNQRYDDQNLRYNPPSSSKNPFHSTMVYRRSSFRRPSFKKRRTVRFSGRRRFTKPSTARSTARFRSPRWALKSWVPTQRANDGVTMIKKFTTVFGDQYVPVVTGTSGGGAAVFSFTSCPRYSTYCDMYDEYKIVKVTCHFIHRPWYGIGSSAAVPGVPGTPIAPMNLYLGRISMYVDTDDASAPLVDEDVTCHQNHIVLFANKDAHVSIVPTVKNVIQTSVGLTNAVSTGKSTWINTSAPDTVHYGLKMFYTKSSSEFYRAHWDYYVEYQVAFRKFNR